MNDLSRVFAQTVKESQAKATEKTSITESRFQKEARQINLTYELLQLHLIDPLHVMLMAVLKAKLPNANVTVNEIKCGRN